MDEHELIKKLLEPKQVKRKKTAKQLHNEIFVKLTKNLQKKSIFNIIRFNHNKIHLSCHFNCAQVLCFLVILYNFYLKHSKFKALLGFSYVANFQSNFIFL